MKAVLFGILFLFLDIVPGGKPYLKQLQERDSILVADQLEYGFVLKGVKSVGALALPDLSRMRGDTLVAVRGWQADTLKRDRKTGAMDISISMVLAPFEAGKYTLPPLLAALNVDGKADTLEFEAVEMEVKTIPLDTAVFVPHDIKGQIAYPLTLREVLPWIFGALLFSGLLFAGLLLYRMRRKRGKAAPEDPPYVVALRKLDRFRGEKYWAPEKQKQFYSGITDAIKEYIDAGFGVDAPEMTTAELFDAIKDEEVIGTENYRALKELFERADFVKFAKMVVSDADNARVLPVAVKFVTDTYQAQLEREQPAKEEGKDVL